MVKKFIRNEEEDGGDRFVKGFDDEAEEEGDDLDQASDDMDDDSEFDNGVVEEEL